MSISPEDRAAINFFDPSHHSGGSVRFKNVKMWRGDHSKCKPAHHDKRCIAARGWQINATARMVPDLVPVSTEARAMATVKVGDAYPISTHQARGWRDASEAEGCRPTDQVVAYVTERAVRSAKANAEQKGAKYEEVEKITGDLRRKIATAHNPPSQQHTEKESRRNG